MSLKKFRKRVVKKAKEKVKSYSRQAISYAAVVSRVARPIVSAAAGYLYGPVGAAAVTAISHYPHQYQETVRARHVDDLRGREARAEGRTHAQRTTIHSAIAGAIGAVGAGITGGWQAGLVGTHGQALTGWGTGAGAFGLTNPFMTVPTTAVATTATSVGTGAAIAAGTQAGVQAVTPKPPAPAPDTSGSWLDNLLNQLGLGGGKGGSDTPGEAPAGAPGGAGGGGGIMDALERAASNDMVKWAAGGAIVAAVLINSRKAA